jgi:hypothetical protein
MKHWSQELVQTLTKVSMPSVEYLLDGVLSVLESAVEQTVTCAGLQRKFGGSAHHFCSSLQATFQEVVSVVAGFMFSGSVCKRNKWKFWGTED